MCPRSRGAFRPRLLAFSPSQINRGRREDRVTAAPGALAPERLREGRVTTGTADITPAFPAQWFTAYSALSPVNHPVCHRRLAMPLEHWRDLAPDLGAPGPHGFAIRNRRRSSISTIASTAIPHHVRDDAYAPCRCGTHEPYT